MKSLRYLAIAVLLVGALLMTGCFGNPGEALIGKWVSEELDIDGTGLRVMTIEVNASPFHLPLVIFHAYMYNVTVTYGDMTWIIPIPNEEQREQLLDKLRDMLDKQETDDNAEAPSFPLFAWACITDLWGKVQEDALGVYCPEKAATDTAAAVPALAMDGNFEGTDFKLNVTVGANTPCTDVIFTAVQ